MSRRRTYELYARVRGGPFTVYTIAYSRGTHLWIYRVYATSVRQAYLLAAREVWAVDARSVGVRSIYHRPGPAEVAPYLRDASERDDRHAPEVAEQAEPRAQGPVEPDSEPQNCAGATIASLGGTGGRAP